MFIDSYLFSQLVLTSLFSINEELTCISTTVFVEIFCDQQIVLLTYFSLILAPASEVTCLLMLSNLNSILYPFIYDSGKKP